MKEVLKLRFAAQRQAPHSWPVLLEQLLQAMHVELVVVVHLVLGGWHTWGTGMWEPTVGDRVSGHGHWGTPRRVSLGSGRDLPIVVMGLSCGNSS